MSFTLEEQLRILLADAAEERDFHKLDALTGKINRILEELAGPIVPAAADGLRTDPSRADGSLIEALQAQQWIQELYLRKAGVQPCELTPRNPPSQTRQRFSNV